MQGLVFRLAAVIELVAIGHPQGLRVLLGEAPEPSVEEILSLMAPMQGDDLGNRVQTFSRKETALDRLCGVEPILSVIQAAGGWGGIVKAVQEVCGIFCATANPLEVVVAETDLGRGIMGVIDGFVPRGAESDEQVEERRLLLRRFGYKL